MRKKLDLILTEDDIKNNQDIYDGQTFKLFSGLEIRIVVVILIYVITNCEHWDVVNNGIFFCRCRNLLSARYSDHLGSYFWLCPKV